MKLTRKNIFISFIFTLICYQIFVFTSSEDFSVLFQYYSYQYSIPDGHIDSNFPITFYHKAFIDHRSSTPRLKVFSLNPCVRSSNYLLADVISENSNSSLSLKLMGKPIEGLCPVIYAPSTPCFYTPHYFTADIKNLSDVENVILHKDDRQIELSIQSVKNPNEAGLTVCLQPVYYYSQWQNIVLYIEAWKSQGASRFIVFYHSATEETRKVLDHYVNLGIIELRPWPSFGNLPENIRGKYPKFDDSVFIFSYVLAMNICILEMKTKLGTIADFDEVMVPRNGNILEYTLKEMTGTNIGALMFKNNYVLMNPSIYTSNFSGVEAPIFIIREGPPKNIFNVTATEIAYVHEIKVFLEPKVTKQADGALLHFRYFVKNPTGTKNETFTFFPNKTNVHVKNMQKTALEIFGTYPAFSTKYIDGLNDCVDKLRAMKSTCRSTGGMCKAEMDKLTKWVYDKTDNIFLA